MVVLSCGTGSNSANIRMVGMVGFTPAYGNGYGLGNSYGPVFNHDTSDGMSTGFGGGSGKGRGDGVGSATGRWIFCDRALTQLYQVDKWVVI